MASQKQLKLNISRVNGSVFAGEVLSVTVPGSEGEMTLLADHSPIVSALRAGTITVRQDGGENKIFEIESGTLEVSHNNVTILL
jgi:F-type H+-transporting ATPase subunit epsilon